MIGFIVGVFVGTFVGIFLASLLVMAKRNGNGESNDADQV